MLQNVGDTVLIKGEENVSSTQWRIGKIKKLVTGKDAQVRSAVLVVNSKMGEKTVILYRLRQLKITVNLVSNNKPVNDSEGADETHILNNRRPTQKAKEEGQYL